MSDEEMYNRGDGVVMAGGGHAAAFQTVARRSERHQWHRSTWEGTGMRRVARGVGVEGVASVRGAVQELDPSCSMQPAIVQDVPEVSREPNG